MARLPTVGGDSGNWGTVLNDYLSRSLKTDGSLRADVPNIADLKALDVSQIPDKMQALVGGYYGHGDGGGGQFYYDAGASDADNGGTVIAPNAGAGRWKRITSSFLTPEMFGAKGDGTTDCTVQLQSALSFVSVNGGNLLFRSGERFLSGCLQGTVVAGKSVTVTGYGSELLSTNIGATNAASLSLRGNAGCIIQIHGLTISHATPANIADGNGPSYASAIEITKAAPGIVAAPDVIVVRDCVVRDAYWAGIKTDYAVKSINVAGNTISNCRGSGIFSGNISTASFSNNHVWNTTDDFIFCGATQLYPAERVSINNNICHNGVGKIGAAGAKIVTVHNNIVRYGQAQGILVMSGSSGGDSWALCEVVEIRGNTLVDVSTGQTPPVPANQKPIHVIAADGYVPNTVVVSNNTVRYSGGSEAINVHQATYVHVKNNAIDSAGKGGIAVGTSSISSGVIKRVIISGNALEIGTDSVSGVNGLILYKVESALVRDNVVSGYTDYAVWQSGSVRISVDESNRFSPKGTPLGIYNFANSLGPVSYRSGASSFQSTPACSSNATDPLRLYIRRPGGVVEDDALSLSITGTVDISGGGVTDGLVVFYIGNTPAAAQVVPVSVYNGTAYSSATMRFAPTANGPGYLYGAPANTTRIYFSGQTIRIRP